MAATPPAGPPYPDAVTGQRVYDYAGIFSSGAISQAQSIIDGIEARTGAQVAVYTQVKPESDDLDKANADALALMNQWESDVRASTTAWSSSSTCRTTSGTARFHSTRGVAFGPRS